jgi:SAM-dependent methyltransferase
VIVELGSYAVNGSLRPSCPSNGFYLGLDLEHGPSVDIVVSPRQPLPMRSDFADLVLSSSQLEHDPFFWQTFLELLRILKPGGALYINAPSNGIYHTHPVDVWRFYPDAGKALADWGQVNGHEVSLIESFTSERKADTWNDFVAIFHKGTLPRAQPTVLISEFFESTNVWTYRSHEILRHRMLSQDLCIIEELRTKIATLTAELANQKARIAELELQIKPAEDQSRHAAAQVHE